MKSAKKVEMHPAHQWDCDNCGRENFVRAIEHHPNREDPEEMASCRECLGLDEWQEVPEGSFTTYPDEVTCQFCSATFEAVRLPSMDDDDED